MVWRQQLCEWPTVLSACSAPPWLTRCLSRWNGSVSVSRALVRFSRVRYQVSRCLFCLGGPTADRTMGKIPARNKWNYDEKSCCQEEDCRWAESVRKTAIRRWSGNDIHGRYRSQLQQTQLWRRSTKIILADKEIVIILEILSHKPRTVRSAHPEIKIPALPSGSRGSLFFGLHAQHLTVWMHRRFKWLVLSCKHECLCLVWLPP